MACFNFFLILLLLRIRVVKTVFFIERERDGELSGEKSQRHDPENNSEIIFLNALFYKNAR